MPFKTQKYSEKLIKLHIVLMLLTGGFAMADEYQQADVYMGLRTQVLSLSAGQIDCQSPVLAVLMETGYAEAVATLVSVADGSASLYLSNGGGIMGAGEYQQVRDSSIALVNLAAKNLGQFKPTSTFPLPEIGYTRFYVITSSGVYSEAVLEQDLGGENHELSAVFFQGHELLSYIRAANQQRNSKQKAPKKH